MPRKASLPELKVEHAVALPLAALVRTELLSCRRLREQSQGLAGGAQHPLWLPRLPERLRLPCTAFCCVFVSSSQTLVNSLSHDPWQV